MLKILKFVALLSETSHFDIRTLTKKEITNVSFFGFKDNNTQGRILTKYLSGTLL